MNIKLGKAYKLSRRMKFRGLDVSIETDKGELRHWYDPHNKTKGSTKMSHPYGYIRRTKGVDGDHVDVYIGPKEDAPNIYVVHQMKAPKFKTYDEDKVMLGFENAASAKAAYLKNFDDPRFFGSMTTMPWAMFEKKVKATFEQPKKIAADQKELQMTPIQKAYAIGQWLAKVAFEERTAGLFSRKKNWIEGVTPEQWNALYETPAVQALHKKLKMPKNYWGHPDLALAVQQEAQKLYDPAFIAKQKELAAKTGEAALGDPNFWGGGTPSPEEEAPPAPQSAEEAVQLLPAGTFQGAQIKIQPDGVRNTTVKVTPDAMAQPDGLASIFQAEPGAKVEMAMPEQQEGAGEQPPMPPEGTPMDPNMAGAPAEEMPPA